MKQTVTSKWLFLCNKRTFEPFWIVFARINTIHSITSQEFSKHSYFCSKGRLLSELLNHGKMQRNILPKPCTQSVFRVKIMTVACSIYKARLSHAGHALVFPRIAPSSYPYFYSKSTRPTGDGDDSTTRTRRDGRVRRRQTGYSATYLCVGVLELDCARAEWSS